MTTCIRPLLTVLLLFVCLPVRAQTPATPGDVKPKPEQTEKNAAQGAQKKSNGQEKPGEKDLTVEQTMALDALRSLADLAKEIEDEVIAVRVQAQIGDALWDKDQVEARTILEKAFKQISQLKKSGVESEYPEALAALSQRFQLRTEILRMISSRDSKWAEELIKSFSKDETSRRENEEDATRQSRPVNQSAPVNQPSLAALYLRMASFFIDRNLPRAIALTRTSLDYGLSQELLGVLYAIRLRDRTSADDLLLAALSTVRRDIVPSTRFINYLGPYVFAGFGQGTPQTTNDALHPSAAAKTPLAMQFLELSYNVITSQTRETLSTLTFEESVLNYMTVRAMIPYFDSYMPDKAAAIRLALAQRDARVPKEDVDAVDLFTDSGSIDELIRRAERVKNGDLKDSMYGKAALMASGADDPERALTIVSNVDDEDMKNGIKTMIGFTAATKAVQKRDPETAYQYARGIPSMPHQVFAFTQVAELLANKQEIQRAKEILLEAKRTIESKLEGNDRVRGWLAAARVMARIDDVMGPEFMGWAVQAMNSIKKFSLSSLNAAPPPSDIKFFDLVNVSLGYNKINLQDGFALLADKDYIGTWLLARSINDKEASIVAQLSVIRRILSKRPTPPPVTVAGPEKKDKAPATPARIETIARDFVGLLASKEFDGAMAKMDDNMKTALQAGKLREYWQGLITQYGAFEKQIGVQTTKRQYEIATVECEFTSSRVFVRIAFNDRKQINGLFFSAESN